MYIVTCLETLCSQLILLVQSIESFTTALEGPSCRCIPAEELAEELVGKAMARQLDKLLVSEEAEEAEEVEEADEAREEGITSKDWHSYKGWCTSGGHIKGGKGVYSQCCSINIDRM